MTTSTTISAEEFEKAMARACIRAVTRAHLSEPLRHGDRTAVMHGAVIRDIADEADLTVPQTRRRLHALQEAGKVIRDDRRGGSTAWWLVGLAEAQRQPVTAPVPAAPPPSRQAFTAPVPARQHWSEVLGVARDCSTTEAREAFQFALDQVNDLDLDAEQQRQRIRAAYDARLIEDGISEFE